MQKPIEVLCRPGQKSLMMEIICKSKRHLPTCRVCNTTLIFERATIKRNYAQFGYKLWNGCFMACPFACKLSGNKTTVSYIQNKLFLPLPNEF